VSCNSLIEERSEEFGYVILRSTDFFKKIADKLDDFLSHLALLSHDSLSQAKDMAVPRNARRTWSRRLRASSATHNLSSQSLPKPFATSRLLASSFPTSAGVADATAELAAIVGARLSCPDIEPPALWTPGGSSMLTLAQRRIARPAR
jgi:hypothetical protein